MIEQLSNILVFVEGLSVDTVCRAVDAVTFQQRVWL